MTDLRYECAIIRTGTSYLAVPLCNTDNPIFSVLGGRDDQTIEAFRQEVTGLIATILAEQGKTLADARKTLDTKGFRVVDPESGLDGMMFRK